MKKLLRLSLLAIGLILFAGCAKTHYKHYEGPPLPDSELALLKVSYRIKKIDGQMFRHGITGEDFGEAITTGLFSEEFGKAYWQILPGKHEISVFVRVKAKPWNRLFTTNFFIEVEKGHAYRIDKKHYEESIEHYEYFHSTFFDEEEFNYYTYHTGAQIFFLVDVCCPSRDPVPLVYRKYNRIE